MLFYFDQICIAGLEANTIFPEVFEMIWKYKLRYLLDFSLKFGLLYEMSGESKGYSLFLKVNDNTDYGSTAEVDEFILK